MVSTLESTGYPPLMVRNSSFQIELFQMSDGQPYTSGCHPSVMGSSYKPLRRIDSVHLQLTSYRLAATVVTVQADDLFDSHSDHTDLFVWDWRTGRTWLVSHSISFACNKQTNLMGALKEHIQKGILTARFIDEYRLFGAVRPDRGTTLMLWDSSNPHNPKDPPGIIFEPGPNSIYSDVHRNARNHETNHVLPFRECPSMGIIALVAHTKHPITGTTIRRTLVIPVGTLASFARRIGEAAYVPWEVWSRFAVPIELNPTAPFAHILHSQVLAVQKVENPLGPTSILRVWDFSLRSRRRQVQSDPSASLPPYTIRVFPLDADYQDSLFDFTEGGVLVTSVRIHVIARHAKVLICTSRIQRTEVWKDISGDFRRYSAVTIRAAGSGYTFKQSISTVYPPPSGHRQSPNTVLCAPLPTAVFASWTSLLK